MTGLVLSGSGLSLVDATTGITATVLVSGQTVIAGGSSGQILYNNAGVVGGFGNTDGSNATIGGALIVGGGGVAGVSIQNNGNVEMLFRRADLTTNINLNALYLRHAPVTVTGAGAASGAGSGSLRYVTDLSAPVVIGTTAVGGGSAQGMMLSDGSNWKVMGAAPAAGVFPLVLSGVSATTSATTEATGIQLFANIPANALGLNGSVEVVAGVDTKSTTSAATYSVRFASGSGGGSGGTNFYQVSVPAGQTIASWFCMTNAGATNAQISTNTVAPNVGTSSGFPAAAIDTTTATVVRFNVFCPNGGGPVVVRFFQVKLLQSTGT